MVQYLPALILTGVFHRETSTMTIFLKFGRKNTKSSETEAGQKPDNVKNVQNIYSVREMDCITVKKSMGSC